MSTEPVVLEGVIVTPIVPSVSLLKTKWDISMLTNTQAIKLRDTVNKYLVNIDHEYAKKPTLLRGRYIETKWVATEQKRVHIMEFSPLPSVMLNRLLSIRRKLYENVLPQFTYPIDVRHDLGSVNRKLYLTTINTLEFVYDNIDDLNDEIYKLNNEIGKYRYGEKFYDFLSTMNEYGAIQISTTEFALPSITLNVTPVALSKTTLDKIINSYKESILREYDKELREKKLKMLDNLKNDMNQRREIYENYIKENIYAKVQDIIKTLHDTKTVSNKTLTLINALQNSINDLGIDEYKPIINRLNITAEQPHDERKKLLEPLINADKETIYGVVNEI